MRNTISYEIEKINFAPLRDPELSVAEIIAVDMPLPNADGTFPQEYRDRLSEINDTYRQIVDPTTGRKFEIAQTHPEATGEGVDLEISTYSSSLTGNVGNAAEFALHSLSHPGRARLYLASIGNGGSDPLDKKELKYFAKTGRMTHEENDKTVAIPTIQSLARALASEDLEVTRVSTDSFGGNIAAGLLTELQRDQVTHSYMKGRPNVSQFTLPRFAWRMMVRESLINNSKSQKASGDPWKLTPSIIETVKESLTNIYQKDSPDFERGGGSRQLFAYANGLRRTTSKGRLLGPAQDVVVAKEHNPNLLLTLDFPDQDLLYKNHEDIIRFFQHVAIMPRVVPSRRPIGIISRGTHGSHAYEPQRRIATEHFAFSRR